MGLYELAVLFDPRLSDEETAEQSDGVKELISTLGAELVKEESWGKKRLAYPIQKLTEARYSFLTIEVNAGNPIPEVEQRLQQNERVLRYMTVRLDEGRLRRRGDGTAPMSTAAELAAADQKEAS
jgi:small subunit ribosomal protein S6